MDDKKIRETVKSAKDTLWALKKEIDEKEAEIRNMKKRFIVLAMLTEHTENVLTLAELDKLCNS